MDDKLLEELWRFQLEQEMRQLLEQNGFNVLKTIGHGSFGKILKVYHPELGEVAAKVMHNKFFDENEWNIAGILSEDPSQTCPFVISYTLAKRFKEKIVIILENCNCGSLQDLIKSKVDIHIPTLRVIIRQILQGLSFIHSKGLIHRDIKAANILLHSPIGSGRVIAKIADFGEVKVKTQLEQSTMRMTIRGTPPYMPPEINLGNQNDQKYSSSLFDIWSLGILVYWMTTHSYPFNPYNEQSIIQFMEEYSQTGVLTRLLLINDDLLWDLLVRMLAFDRKNRISAVDALNHPFFTGEQAIREISPEQSQLSQTAQIAQGNGDKSITKFDINPQYVLSLNEVKRISKQDYPETQIQLIQEQNKQSQPPSPPADQYIQIPNVPIQEDL
ncbi:MAG: putative serine/threonine-protein kinase unc-51 [Streblomastix strix]|uniref:Putative serine/threonine-protein kinase unc-51 n=1 Tax=Streblomastix strix TaxID=222440 RepID=A0A5J4VRH7_9EUKA|nr:MAG: putative serine/threonine-protein kinase unc-51 [Streblomastix strix]